MQTYYENWKKTADAKRKLKNKILDPEGLLTGNGFIEGVYEFSYYNIKTELEITAYIGQAGDDPTAPDYVASDIYERILQHLKRWMGGDYFTYWTGLEDDDNSDWRIKINLLCEEKNHSRRLELESKYIEEKKPLLQDTQGGKYSLYPTKYAYKRNDLCISPWCDQRKKAFDDRVAEIEKAC